MVWCDKVRSSPPDVFLVKGVLGKGVFRDFIEITLRHGCSLVSLLHFQNTFSEEHLWRAAPAKCDFIVKNSSLKCWLRFRLLLLRIQKIILVYNFEARLILTTFLELSEYSTVRKSDMYIFKCVNYLELFNYFMREIPII